MYEPIRSKSIHSMTDQQPAGPPRSREETLDIQLAGYLAALLTVTDELGLTAAADTIATQVTRLRGAAPVRRPRRPGRERTDAERADDLELHRRARALAERALVVAEARDDSVAAGVSEERAAAHAAALRSAEPLAGIR